MSKLSFVLLVFQLLLSLHACNARHLSLTDKKIDRKSHIVSEDVHSRKLIRSFFVHSEPTVVETQKHGSTSSTSGAGEFANTVMGKDSAAVILNKGTEVAISYSEETAQREKWRQARLTLESSPDEVKETANSEDDDTIDDVVSMDYAKPHRKPPIHNRKL